MWNGRNSRCSGRSTGYASQGELHEPQSLASDDKALRFLNGMSREQMHITKLLQGLEAMLLDSGRRGEGEKVGLVAARLSHARDIDRALQALYGVSGWNAVAIRLMWYVEQMRHAAGGVSASGDLFGHQVAELLAAMPAPAAEERDVNRAPDLARTVDIRDALSRFGSALEELRRASFSDGAFSALPESILDRVIEESGLLERVASAQQSRDVARFAKAFTVFATHVREQGILQDVRVLHVIGTANLTLQTVLETAQADDFDSLYQTIALLESPQTLLQPQ